MPKIETTTYTGIHLGESTFQARYVEDPANPGTYVWVLVPTFVLLTADGQRKMETIQNAASIASPATTEALRIAFAAMVGELSVAVLEVGPNGSLVQNGPIVTEEESE